MRQAETISVRPTRGIWRILLGILVILFVVLVAVAANLKLIRELSAGDILADAAHSLASAEERLLIFPNDESAHLARAKAYITFGHLEGAHLDYANWHENSSDEWGEIARILDELQLKTDEIRSLLHEAETADWPADHYAPIYTLLDDIADRFEGIPRCRALFLKGYLLLREGRKTEAEPIFANELDDYFLLRDYVMYNNARSLMVEDMENQALGEFDHFIQEFPSSRLAPLAHLERINIFRDLDLVDDALNECRRAIDAYPTNAFAAKTLRKWAEIYETEMDFDNGADIRIRILSDYPQSDEVDETIDMFYGGVYSPQLLDESDRLVVAYAAIESHVDEAFEILSELAGSESLSAGERAQACHGAARCEYSHWRYYEVIRWSETALSLAPGTEWADRAGIRIGHAYWHLDKENLAKEAYWDVVRGHGPLASLAAEILWEKCYEDQDLVNVSDACMYIVDEYPDSDEAPAALTMLAYLGCRDGRYQSARGYAEHCISSFPSSESSAEAKFWLARALVGLGRNVEAGSYYQELARTAPWNFWGIRASEISRYPDEPPLAIDPFDFSSERYSVYDGTLALAWELYYVGILELAESEFLLAMENGVPGALAGLALVYIEQGRIHSGVVTIRDAAAIGDQRYLTPARQEKILDLLYPRPFNSEVRSAALAHDVHPSWLWGAMRQESCFNPNARSSVGATGLIQIMPETGRFIAAQRGANTFDPEVLWDPATNLDYGAWYFSYLRDRVGDDRLMDIFAAYNGGPGRLGRYRDQLPTRDNDIFIRAIPREETRNFARWVYANTRMYEMILKRVDFQLVPF